MLDPNACCCTPAEARAKWWGKFLDSTACLCHTCHPLSVEACTRHSAPPKCNSTFCVSKTAQNMHRIIKWADICQSQVHEPHHSMGNKATACVTIQVHVQMHTEIMSKDKFTA